MLMDASLDWMTTDQNNAFGNAGGAISTIIIKRDIAGLLHNVDDVGNIN